MIPIVAIAAGAAAMYYFDPEAGARRRALVRDKFAWLRDEVGDVRGTAEGKAEHFRNVAKGMFHETRSKLTSRSDSPARSDTADTVSTTDTVNSHSATSTTGTTDSTSHMDTSSNVTDLHSKRAA